MAEVVEERRQQQSKALLARLARVEGQIRGIRRMIEGGESCESLAQQLAAARKALNKAFYEMMACSIENEMIPVAAGAQGAEKLLELTRLLTKYG